MYRDIERSLIRPLTIITGISSSFAIRRKFGQISVSTSKIAIGFIMFKILRVKKGKSKGKKIIPSASGMIRRAIA